MGSSPAPFSDIGKRAHDLLTKDYKYGNQISISLIPGTLLEMMVTGFLNGLIFLGDLRAQYASGRTNVDVKVDTFTDLHSDNMLSLGTGRHVHPLYVSTKVTVHEAMPHTRAILNFDVPDHRSGRLFVQYLHPRVAIDSSIYLNSSPFLYVAAAVGHKDVLIGGEVGFDTASASFTNYTAGISFNNPDLSAALLLMDKGQTLKASYVHFVNGSDKNQVVAEMTHRLGTLENSFSIGSSHIFDRYRVKAKFSDNGKVAMLCQREWRPQSLVTFSAEYDTKRTEVFPKWGLAIDLKV